MDNRRSLWWYRTALATLGLCGFCAGCHSSGGFMGVDRGATITKGAIPAPAGSHVCQWQQNQALRAEQDDFVINSNEWFGGGKELGPDGRRHLSSIARQLPTSPFPVLIAADDDQLLNETRKQIVIELLQEQGVSDAQERTIVGYPEAEGLYGMEAARYGTMRMMGVGGMGGGMGGGFGGGMGSGGLGGGMGSGMGMF